MVTWQRAQLGEKWKETYKEWGGAEDKAVRCCLTV